MIFPCSGPDRVGLENDRCMLCCRLESVASWVGGLGRLVSGTMQQTRTATLRRLTCRASTGDYGHLDCCSNDLKDKVSYNWIQTSSPIATVNSIISHHMPENQFAFSIYITLSLIYQCGYADVALDTPTEYRPGCIEPIYDKANWLTTTYSQLASAWFSMLLCILSTNYKIQRL